MAERRSARTTCHDDDDELAWDDDDELAQEPGQASDDQDGDIRRRPRRDRDARLTAATAARAGLRACEAEFAPPEPEEPDPEEPEEPDDPGPIRDPRMEDLALAALLGHLRRVSD